MSIPVSSASSRRERYLNAVAERLRLSAPAKQEIMREMEAHLEDRVAELEQSGLTPQEAQRLAIEQMGDTGGLTEELYAVHSRGSLRDILLATLPHLLLAALFALHLWTELVAVMGAVVIFTLIAYLGWRANGAKWTYSWLGYCLAAPTISWLLAIVTLAYAGWQFLANGSLPFGLPLFLLLAAYIPFGLWIVSKVTLKLVKQDWLLASLTALPFPFLASWALFLNWHGSLWGESAGMPETDSARVVIFLALAVTTAVFFMVGRRLVQILLLTLSTLLMVIYTAIAIPLTFGLLAIILALLASVAFLFSPVILERKLFGGVSSSPATTPAHVVTHWFHAAP